MSIWLVVLFILAGIAVPVLWIWKGVAPFPKGENKTLLIAFISIVSVAAVLLLLATAFIPSKSDQAIKAGIVHVETALNSLQPHMTDSLLTTDMLDNLTGNAKTMKTYIQDNAEVGWFIRIVGLNSFVDYVTSLADTIVEQQREFNISEKILHSTTFLFLRQRKSTSR